MAYCDEHDTGYDAQDPQQRALHDHPETLTKQQLRDALVASGYGDTPAWAIADDAFGVSMADLARLA